MTFIFDNEDEDVLDEPDDYPGNDGTNGGFFLSDWVKDEQKADEEEAFDEEDPGVLDEDNYDDHEQI